MPLFEFFLFLFNREWKFVKILPFHLICLFYLFFCSFFAGFFFKLCFSKTFVGLFLLLL